MSDQDNGAGYIVSALLWTVYLTVVLVAAIYVVGVIVAPMLAHR